MQPLLWRVYNDVSGNVCDGLDAVNTLVPSYNRFSHHARRALTHTGQVAARLRHPLADTGHLLTGVALAYGSVGSQIMQTLNFNAAQAEQTLRMLLPSVPWSPADVPNAADLDAALTLAVQVAAELGHAAVGTGHLLLGLLSADAGQAPALLRALEVSPEQVRRRAWSALQSGPDEPDLQAAKRAARLSELSRRVINAAELLAVQLDHPAVGVGHLLLVMLLEERSPISSQLRRYGLDEARLRAGLDAAHTALLASLEPVLAQARDQAERLGSHYTGTEHLLLTLADDDRSAPILEAYGIAVDALRAQLLADLETNRRRS